jgi:hypothetical protein
MIEVHIHSSALGHHNFLVVFLALLIYSAIALCTQTTSKKTRGSSFPYVFPITITIRVLVHPHQ